MGKKAAKSKKDRKPKTIGKQYCGDAMSEIQAFFKKTGKTTVAMTVKGILDEQIAYKLA